MFARSLGLMVVVAVLVAPVAEAAGKRASKKATPAVESTAKSRTKAVALYAKALKLFDAGRVSEARQLVMKSLSVDPLNARANLLAGSIAQTTGHTDEAVAHYKRFLSYAPRGSQLREVSSVLARLLETTPEQVEGAIAAAE